MAFVNRTPDDIIKFVEQAGVEKSDLLPTFQTLQFTDNIFDSSVKLLEVDNNILQNMLEGDKIVFRGDQDESVVLCTEDKTFEVRVAETSNCLLLVPDVKLPEDILPDGDFSVENVQVNHMRYTYLEIRPCLPRLKKLYLLLNECLYGGPHEENESGQRYTFEDLLNRVQCSEKELISALEEIEAYHIEGCWRILTMDYQFRTVSLILNLVSSNSWPLDGILRRVTLETLAHLVPVSILEQIFSYYLRNIGKTDENGDPLFSLVDDKVCRLCAEVILKEAHQFNYKEFLTLWQQSVPEGMMTNLEQLNGLAIVDKSRTPSVIVYYPLIDLPAKVTERMAHLFETKEKWTLSEITPYVKDLASAELSVSSLLTKYARSYVVDGIRYFSSRYPR